MEKFKLILLMIVLMIITVSCQSIKEKSDDIIKRENKKYALASQCIGLGMGIATIIESVE